MNNPIELEKKRTHADKNVIRAAFILGGIALAACLTALLLHPFYREAAAKTFSVVFYPALLLIAGGSVLATAELLRNRYLSAILALLMNALALISLVVCVIVEAGIFDTVYILPFSSPF